MSLFIAESRSSRSLVKNCARVGTSHTINPVVSGENNNNNHHKVSMTRSSCYSLSFFRDCLQYCKKFVSTLAVRFIEDMVRFSRCLYTYLL